MIPATTVGFLVVLVGISIPLAAAFVLLALYLDGFFAILPVTTGIGELAWSSSTSFTLMAIPFFVLMGEIMVRAGTAGRMYQAIRPWLSWLPGGLMHSNIAASAIFAATSGSSVATASTISTVALPQMKRDGYNERLFLGSLASGGTLGILIPPSINMVIFGVLTDTSIPQLFLAGVVPGILLSLLFMAAIVIICLIRPAFGGRIQTASWQDRFAGLPHLLPPLGIFLIVIGAIYTGLATVTESAALGVIAALVLAVAGGNLSMAVLRRALESTMSTVGMIMLIIVAASFLNFAMAASGFVRLIHDFIVGLELSPTGLALTMVAFYFVLGCFMEVLSMMVLTVPIVVPVMTAAGFDPVWTGVLVVVLSEVATVTPPVGINLYVVHSVRKGGATTDVMIGVLPFLVAMAVLVALLLLAPNIALWLPHILQ